MKRRYVLALASLGVVSLGQFSRAQNLITNGSFEDTSIALNDGGYYPVGWTQTNPNGFDEEYSDVPPPAGNAVDGSNYLQLGNFGQFGQITSHVLVQGETILFSAWGRTFGPNSNPYDARLYADPTPGDGNIAEGDLILQLNMTPNQQSMKHYLGQYTVPASEAGKTLSIYLATQAPTCGYDALSATVIPQPLSPQWGTDSSGDWNTSGNWFFGVPNGVGAEADFTSAITAPRTVFTDTAITLGTIQFNNTSSYQLTGQGSLTMQVSSGAASINVASGSQKINLPLYFASNTNIGVAGGATLTLANPTTINANQTVTTNGSVLIQAPLTLQSGATLVNGGGAMSVFGAPSLAASAKVDLKNNSMTVDYRGQADPSSTILSQLKSGYANGAWNGSGIDTSSNIAGQTALGWKDDPASQSILVKLVRSGDTNLSGTVDSNDFATLAANYGKTGQVWVDGDFNYDGTVNALDFNALATNYGQSLSAPMAEAALGSVVPEPSGLAVLLAGTSVLISLGRRRRLA